MFAYFRKATLAGALAATATMAATPAQAQSYDRYDRHRGGDAGTAIAAGIVGLAIGAALSSGDHGRYYNGRDYRDSYDYPQYRGGYYNNYRQYNGYQQYNGYYYNNQDRRYRDEDRYERKHERWHERHDRHDRWDD